MKNYTHLINSLFNQPHLVTGEYFQTVCGAVADRFGLPSIQYNGETIDAERLKIRAELFNSERPDQRRRFYDIKDGIAIIEINGTLVHKNGYLHTSSGMTGYDGIKRRIDYAMSDPEVKGIFYIYDTPGGHVVGNFELVDYMHSLKGIKPTAALIDAQACSAGFSMASSADYRYITEHATAGSVGVLLPHISKQGQLEKEGVKVDIIHAGNHKIDGNPFQDLTKEKRAEMQATVNKIYDRFTNVTARNLGVEEKTIRETEARVYMGQEAIDVGFANELTPSFEGFDRFKERLLSNSNVSVPVSKTMAQGPKSEGSEKMESPENAPVATALSGTEQKTRLKAITALGSTLNCVAVASVIALDTDISATDAELVLNAVNDNQTVDTVEANDQSGKEAFQAAVELADAGPIGSEATTEVSDDPKEATQLERLISAADASGIKAKI